MSKFRNIGEKLPKITKNLTYSCNHWENFPNNKSTWYESWKSSENLYSVGYTEIDSIDYILARVHGNEEERAIYYFKESDILELAKEQNMIEEEFKLPEKWYLPLEKEYLEEVKKWMGRFALEYNLGDWSSVYYNKTATDTLNVPKDFTKITYEQFKKYVLKEDYPKVDLKNDEFIVDCTNNSHEERKKVYEFLCEKRGYSRFTYSGNVYPVIVCNRISGNSNYEGLKEAKRTFPRYPVLTFAEFEKKYLNMNKKIVGYKLLKELPFVKIGTVSYFNSKNECSFETKSQNITDSFIFTKEELEEAPDWFQPVYELEDVTLTLSNGKSVVVGKEKIKAEDINIHFRDLQNIITLNKNRVNNWGVELTDATYKIGCWENVKLSDIKLILKTYKDFTK